MRSWAWWLRWVLVALALSVPAAGAPRTHVVAQGQTLGGIAHRYGVSTEELAAANRMRTTDVLPIGKRLVIPPHDRATTGTARERAAAPSHPETLLVPGAGPVYYFEPVGRGRLGLRPLIVYLHARGGDPARDCERWAPLARPLGWLVCPSGPGYYGGGRTWNNNWRAGNAIVTATVRALRERFGRRVQLYGNTLVGFSEGAFVAMNVGVRSPRTFNRWLILGASDGYLGAGGRGMIAASRSSLRRVALITGERDAVVAETRRASTWFEASGVPLRLVTPATLAHELALDRDPALYGRALAWLVEG